MNAGAAFQREMDIAFVEEKDKFMVIYMDDITLLSKYGRDHLKHLEKVFLTCRRYGISNFSLKEGKIMGHIICNMELK